MAFQLFIAVSVLFFHLLATSSTGAASDDVAVVRYEPQEYIRICPLPKCESCPTVEELRAPGVGFNLGTSHGTAVVRLHDGTFHHVALIEGDTSYTTLMRRLATGPTSRTPNHFDTFWGELRYLKSRAQRLFNKLVGRPATPETAVLASMVSTLLETTQTWLGGKQAVVAAVLSSPDHIGLTKEEIGDIFDYLELQNLMDGPLSLYELYETSAAYAGYGRGLCRTYTDAYTCEREEAKLLSQRVLHVDFNPESLGGTIRILQSVRHTSVDASFVDPDLGLRHEDARLVFGTGDGHDSELYWTAVSDRIRDLVQSLNRFYLPQVTELLLTGPSVANNRFKATIKAALHDLVADQNVSALLENYNETVRNQDEWQTFFSFAAARGAAEIAKRRQEGPVDCAQSDECKKRREHVHDDRSPKPLSQYPSGRLW